MGNPCRIILLVYAIINIVIGLGVTAVAIWLHAQKDIYAYMSIFVRSASDTSLVSAAGLLLATGIILTATSIIGLFAVLRNHQMLLLLYLWLQALVLILGIIAGFITVALYWDMHMHVKQGMKEQLSNFYSADSTQGKAWNRVQVKKRCCGADGSWDYKDTNWYGDNNEVDQAPTKLVPDSCCALNFNQDTTLYWVDPEQLQLKDALRCQQDATGNIGNSANLNTKGCFAALFHSNDDLRDYWRNIYLDVSIFTIISVIEGLGLGAGFLQLVGIILTWQFRKAPPQSMDLRSKR